MPGPRPVRTIHYIVILLCFFFTPAVIRRFLWFLWFDWIRKSRIHASEYVYPNIVTAT